MCDHCDAISKYVFLYALKFTLVKCTGHKHCQLLKMSEVLMVDPTTLAREWREKLNNHIQESNKKEEELIVLEVQDNSFAKSGRM